jgi:hypothetical protein
MSEMARDVPVAGNYPAVEVQPSETSSVWHTDQELTDGSGNSRMHRTYNAQNTGGSWTTLTEGASDAYATAEKPDGSIHDHWNGGSSSWTERLGSHNKAAYNAVDFRVVQGSGQSRQRERQAWLRPKPQLSRQPPLWRLAFLGERVMRLARASLELAKHHNDALSGKKEQAGMNWLRFRFAAVGACAGALLVGCGGSQPPLGAPIASPQSSAIKKHGDRAGLWMAPGATAGHSGDYAASGSLLYITNSNPVYNDVTVYHAGARDPAPIATISDGLNGPAGDCLDSQGTLYVTNEPISNGGSIVEYAFGKTVPLRVVTEGIDTPAFCAIDSDGNLWVTNIGGPNATEYLHGSKKPHTVITKDMVYPTGIAIDSSGNLYVSNRLSSGGDVVVFPSGSTTPSRTITDGVTSPVALAIDASGDLYVTNVTQNNIEEYRPGGDHPFRTITQGVSTPAGLTVSERGWLFAANLERDTVVEFRAGSARLSKRSISKGLHAPIGVAIYPAVLPSLEP